MQFWGKDCIKASDVSILHAETIAAVITVTYEKFFDCNRLCLFDDNFDCIAYLDLERIRDNFFQSARKLYLTVSLLLKILQKPNFNQTQSWTYIFKQEKDFGREMQESKGRESTLSCCWVSQSSAKEKRRHLTPLGSYVAKKIWLGLELQEPIWMVVAKINSIRYWAIITKRFFEMGHMYISDLQWKMPPYEYSKKQKETVNQLVMDNSVESRNINL